MCPRGTAPWVPFGLVTVRGVTATTPRVLVLMGSGETAPTMVKPHRAIFDLLDPGPIDAVMLETPFGFQENADELTEKSLQYFDQTIGRSVRGAGLKRTDTGDTVAIEQAIARIRQANWVFAGPGSPTFALRQWADTPVPRSLIDKLTTGGVVVFSSAAALTVGLRTVPVYEVYKVGAEPHWLEGLDLLSTMDLPVSVIPHYDNNEGQTHDTRMCYLGESRLSRIEADLPDGSFILGIDEHTGITFDLDADTAEIFGKGVITVRDQGESVTIPAGVTISIDVLRNRGRDGLAPSRGAQRPLSTTADDNESPAEAAPAASVVTLGGIVREQEAIFGAALTARDADTAVGAVLTIEQAIVDWSADTGLNAEMSEARAALRSMVVRLGEAARDGVRDPREVMGPVVSAVLELRRTVRDEKRYDLSDLIRDELAKADIEVRDTADGVEWVLGTEA